MIGDFDSIVIGGGLVGTAIAYGIARLGKRPVLLDEGDIAHRASRGNFGLVWVQSKGFGVPEYPRWTRRSSDAWADFSQELLEATGIGTGRERPGGVGPCQGQLRGLTAVELIAECRGGPVSEVGYHRIRSPIKPVIIGDLATLDLPERNDAVHM